MDQHIFMCVRVCVYILFFCRKGISNRRIYLPRKVSATKPPSKQSMKDVPRKLVTVLADVALPKCMVSVKYGTKLTAIPNVINLSQASLPEHETHDD